VTPAALAQTHRLAFCGKGWPTADFERYMTDEKILIHGVDTCFAVFQLAGPDAEILTLATHPNVQGKGHAGAMLRGALDALTVAKIEAVFLDVADDNTAALALYARTGFMPFSTRRNYYANGASAICMKVVLPPVRSRAIP
jgi:ribosomal-protein-alanine N-acetyltransferase